MHSRVLRRCTILIKPPSISRPEITDQLPVRPPSQFHPGHRGRLAGGRFRYRALAAAAPQRGETSGYPQEPVDGRRKADAVRVGDDLHNGHEFGPDKDDPAPNAHRLKSRPGRSRSGRVKRSQTFRDRGCVLKWAPPEMHLSLPLCRRLEHGRAVDRFVQRDRARVEITGNAST